MGCPKRSSLKNWKGRDEEEDPGTDGEVERDLQVLGVRRWRELVTDGDKRRGIVRQAKAWEEEEEEEEEDSLLWCAVYLFLGDT